MSGQQIGTIVGGVIGAYFGNPQLGAMIGGMIGGAVDPTKVYGPRLTDAQNQTAMDGVPRAYGDGTFPCKGNLIWQDIVKEHKHTDDGKGSGQEQITYTYTRSYAIGVCKGPISGYKIIKRNGKIVFDARTDAELSALGYTAEQIAESRAAQAKFLQKCTLYYGTADQLPDPTIVAVKGVGNVPAYTGTAYIVLTDDETMQGEVAQYEFVVANCGDRHEDDSPPASLLVSGSATGSDPYYGTADASAVPAFEGIAQSTGADLANGIPAYYDGIWAVATIDGVRYSLDDRATWLTGTASVTGAAGQTPRCFAAGPDGWVINGVSASGPNFFQIAGQTPSAFHNHPTGIKYSIIGEPLQTMLAPGFFRYTAGKWWTTGGGTGIDAGSLFTAPTLATEVWDTQTSGGVREWATYWYDVCDFNGVMYGSCRDDEYFDSGDYGLKRSFDGGATWETVVDAGSDIRPVQLEAGDEYIICLSRNGAWAWTSADNFATAHATGISTDLSGTLVQEDQIGRLIRFSAGRFYIVSGANTSAPDKANKCVVTADGLTFSDPISLGITSAKGIATRDLTEDDRLRPIPDSPGYYIDTMTGEIVGPAGTTIDVCTPTLGSIVSKQCAKRISTDVIDVSELTEQVVGFRIAAPSSPQKNIGALMPGYFFDGSEYDGKLRFPKRGGEDSFALTIDDLCEREGDLIQWERTQEPELLRKLTVAYLDPDTTYTATTQQWERRSGTVLAQGEGTIELPIVGSKDWAAQAAHINGKVSWGEPDKCTFHTSIAQAKLVTAAVGTITDEAGTVHRVRIERIEDEGLVRMVEARRTRADLYESTVSGAAKPLPLFPGSNIRGPTDGLLLNLPVIVDANDVPGIAWAASGYLSGWAGTTLQFQRAGQWVDAGTVTLPATMGTLLAALPAHAGDIDNTNTISVRMNGSLESVTFTNLLQERNPLAILYPDGTAEIVQFQTATEVAAGEYELTTLIRGRLNTVRGDHASGACVVFLDNSVQYARLEPTDLGTTLTYRFVPLGTDPDAAPVLTMDLDTMQSQTEWPVDSLAVEQDGDDFILTWLARDRLGTDVFPIRSANWRGYEVSWSYGGNTHSETVLTESVTFNLPGASDITFSVAQLNLYTGAGPAQTVTIP